MCLDHQPPLVIAQADLAYGLNVMEELLRSAYCVISIGHSTRHSTPLAFRLVTIDEHGARNLSG